MFPFQYVSLFVCLTLCPTACVYVSLFACRCFFLFAILAVCLPVCLNHCMSVCLLCCLYICISVQNPQCLVDISIDLVCPSMLKSSRVDLYMVFPHELFCKNRRPQSLSVARAANRNRFASAFHWSNFAL